MESGGVDLNQTWKLWLLLYGLISIGTLLPLVIWGMKDPLSLTPLLVAGGLVESLPAVILLLTSVLSLAVALRLHQRKIPYKNWVFYSGMCLFLAGEEASWGHESILGWQVLMTPLFEKGDLHNWVMRWLKHRLRILEPNDLFAITLLVAAVAVVFGTIWLSTCKKRGQNMTAVNWGIWNNLPQMFLVLGLVLIILGNFFDFIWEVGFPYFRGQWPLEESLELLGSVAFLFAALARIHEEVQRGRSVTLAEIA